MTRLIADHLAPFFLPFHLSLGTYQTHPPDTPSRHNIMLDWYNYTKKKYIIQCNSVSFFSSFDRTQSHQGVPSRMMGQNPSPVATASSQPWKGPHRPVPLQNSGPRLSPHNQVSCPVKRIITEKVLTTSFHINLHQVARSLEATYQKTQSEVTCNNSVWGVCGLDRSKILCCSVPSQQHSVVWL